MTDSAQFGPNPPEAGAFAAFDCAAVELWLAESAENVLPSRIEEKVRRHAVECAACNEKLAQTRKGREWLLILKQEALEPPADLMAKILVQTGMAQTHLAKAPAGDAVAAPAEKSVDSSVPLWQRSPVVVLRRAALEPRLALVAAMALFSISLTLNLMGIQFSGLHASDLSPHGVRRMITRQYADANARVVRYYENLRVVYEVEAHVQQVRRASEAEPSPEPPKKPRKQSFNFHPHTRGQWSGSGMEREDRRAGYRTIENEPQTSPTVSELILSHDEIVVEAEMRQISMQERRWA